MCYSAVYSTSSSWVNPTVFDYNEAIVTPHGHFWISECVFIIQSLYNIIACTFVMTTRAWHTAQFLLAGSGH